MSHGAEQWVQRADDCVSRGALAEAAAALEEGVQAFPEVAGLHNRLGMVRHAQGRYADALRVSDRLLRMLPQSAVVWSNRARTMQALARLPEAIVCADKAIECDPLAPNHRVQRGMLLAQLQRHDDALDAFDEALSLSPNFAAAWAQRSGALRAFHRYDEALESCVKASNLDPKLASAWEQRAYCELALGRRRDALVSLDRAIQIDPSNGYARFSRGALRLTLGEFEAGWVDYDARAAAQEALAGSDAPIWQHGETLRGRTIALRAEQGLGDTLQFCRFVPILAGLGAKVLLTAPRVLAGLLASLRGAQVLCEGDRIPKHELQCPLLGVPRRLGIRVESIPAQVPYLHAPKDLQREWREKVAGDRKAPRMRVGIAFSGRSSYANDHNRSMSLAAIAPLIRAHPKVEWHLLQTELRLGEDEVLANLGVVDHRSALRDFTDTAAMIQAMHAVVSVDTSVAHLAGALARPLFLLLPLTPDWRWMLDRTDSPWYPSALLLRQVRAGDWTRPLDELSQALAASCTTEPKS